jgi:Leucine-rich repeat (LRR) protein
MHIHFVPFSQKASRIPFLLSKNRSTVTNAFTGTIPSEIGLLTSLTVLGFCTCSTEKLKMRIYCPIFAKSLTYSFFAFTKSRYRVKCFYWNNSKRDWGDAGSYSSGLRYVFYIEQLKMRIYCPILAKRASRIPRLLSQNPAKDDNALTGTVPSEIGLLTSLTSLYFGTCSISAAPNETKQWTHYTQFLLLAF